MRLVRMRTFGIEYMSVEVWSKLLPNCTATWWQALRFHRNQFWRMWRVFRKFLENMQTANCMASSTFQLWTNYVCQENDIPGVCLWLWNRMATLYSAAWQQMHDSTGNTFLLSSRWIFYSTELCWFYRFKLKKTSQFDVVRKSSRVA